MSQGIFLVRLPHEGFDEQHHEQLEHQFVGAASSQLLRPPVPRFGCGDHPEHRGIAGVGELLGLNRVPSLVEGERILEHQLQGVAFQLQRRVVRIRPVSIGPASTQIGVLAGAAPRSLAGPVRNLPAYILQVHAEHLGQIPQVLVHQGTVTDRAQQTSSLTECS